MVGVVVVRGRGGRKDDMGKRGREKSARQSC
jgi:hypothetical protein